MNKTVKLFQKHIFRVKNSYEPENQPGKRVLDDGRVLLNDIRYGNDYPNSYLDVYLSPAEIPVHPVLFYVHGGGYTWGTKEDYSADSSEKGMGFFFSRLSRMGFHVVSVNYAYAPEYPYPTPIRQLTQAIDFLKSNTELPLHFDSVVFGGDSAGGQLIGQLINLQTNKAYAEEMKVAQVLPADSIKAAVFFSGLLDLERFGVTHGKVTDWLFAKCGYAYFGTDRLPGNKSCIQAGVINHVTPDFPPSFISDGNSESCFDQARDLAERFDAVGVPHELVLYPVESVKLGHGYETGNSPQAMETKSRAIEFLKRVL